MVKPKVIVITGYGINCEEETAKCFNQTGSEADIIHINDLIEENKKLNYYQILVFPGGFSYADETGSGNALANKIRNNLEEQIFKFAQSDKLVIGICNGFQILANLGLIPAVNSKYGQRQAALMPNNTARLQCRWIWLKLASKKSVWTLDTDFLHVPIAHGEGNFYVEENILAKMKSQDQIVYQYVKEDGSLANGEFPHNPNGALNDIAAVCDPTGRILGIMPHPERFSTFENEEGWELKKEELVRARKPLPKEGEGLKIFKNASRYFR